MKKRKFYLQDDQSNKYWTVEVRENSLVTTNGRIGAKPRETRTDHATHEAALHEAEKEILGKRRKGYLEGDLNQVPDYAPGLPPRFVRINHDDYHAKYVGKTSGGDQFFLTFPFVPHNGAQAGGGNYIALYVFDEFGVLKDARIHSEQAQGLTTQTAVAEFVDGLLQGLGKHKFADIRVVTAEPGNYMAFNPPWDGDYDT